MADDSLEAIAERIARRHARKFIVGCEYDDLRQIALLALHDARASFDASRGKTLEQYASVKMKQAVIDEKRLLGPKTRGGNDRLRRYEVDDMDAFLERQPDSEPDEDEPDTTPLDGIDVLNPRQRRIIAALADDATMREVGEREGITKSRVSQIRKAVRLKVDAATNGRPVERREQIPPNPSNSPSRHATGWPIGRDFHLAPGQLSRYELEVLRAAADGLTAQETSARYTVGLETVKSHRKQIIHKLGARSIIHAVALGFRGGHIS